MHIVRDLAQKDKLVDSVIHTQAIKIFNAVDNDEKLAKVCYWLASAMEIAYPLGGCATDIFLNEGMDIHIEDAINIFVRCGGDLMQPKHDREAGIEIRNDVYVKNDKIIGKGTYGKVAKYEEDTVVKITNWCEESHVEAFFRECTALIRLNRLRFIGFNKDKRCVYVGMEYYPGKFESPYTIQNMIEIAEELMVIHNAGVVHGDLSYLNICKDKNDCCKIIDFGGCRFTPTDPELNTRIPPAEHFLQTPHTIDYTLVSGQYANYNHSYEVDIWALGVLFYLMETETKIPWLGEYRDTLEKNIKRNISQVYLDSSYLINSMLTLKKGGRWDLPKILEYLKSEKYVEEWTIAQAKIQARKDKEILLNLKSQVVALNNISNPQNHQTLWDEKYSDLPASVSYITVAINNLCHNFKMAGKDRDYDPVELRTLQIQHIIALFDYMATEGYKLCNVRDDGIGKKLKEDIVNKFIFYIKAEPTIFQDANQKTKEFIYALTGFRV